MAEFTDQYKLIVPTTCFNLILVRRDKRWGKEGERGFYWEGDIHTYTHTHTHTHALVLHQLCYIHDYWQNSLTSTSLLYPQPVLIKPESEIILWDYTKGNPIYVFPLTWQRNGSSLVPRLPPSEPAKKLVRATPHCVFFVMSAWMAPLDLSLC